MVKCRYVICLLLLLAVQGCASPDRTLTEVYDMFEEDDYTNWEIDEAYFERMEAEYKGNVSARLINTFDQYGKALYQDKVENTLGLDLSDGVYFSTAFMGTFSAIDLAGTLLGMNSDSPNFGSMEYSTMTSQRTHIQAMSKNSVFFASKFSPDELATYHGIQPQSNHHEIHLKAKQLFITSLTDKVDRLQKQGIECSPLNYDPTVDQGNFSRARIYIRPLSQYGAGYQCHLEQSELILSVSTHVIRNEDSYDIILSMYIENLPDFNSIDINELYTSEYIDGMMTTCRSCDEKLDRTVVIRSKHQPDEWVERYEKGSIYK